MVKVKGAYLAVNAAFSNTKGEDGQPVPTWQSMLSASHEFGHNLGANHDCSLEPGDSAQFVDKCEGMVSECYTAETAGGPVIQHAMCVFACVCV